MKISPVKGTRDFYPPQMAVHNFIVDGWKAASLRNGFEEYDGPIFEYLKMYQVKSGEEIVDQLFNLTDRGGRDLAIRPEITPTLARMVNQQINSLSKPVKWFSVPRLCRAERPQKGRLREFYQWNIDIIGIDDVLADAEVIYTSVDYLRSTGLGSDDVKARISSRKLLAAVLASIGIEPEKFDALYALLDKKNKIGNEKFAAMLSEHVPDEKKAEIIKNFMAIKSVDDISQVVKLNDDADKALKELIELFGHLELMGISDYCVFDPGIVRGLAYYTGPVFEVHDTSGSLRAVCGGGRFDNLLRDFGGPSIPATGMGMGDAVLEILLENKGLFDENISTRRIEYFVACADDSLREKTIELVARLRDAGFGADFAYKSTNLGKQLKTASAYNAKHCIILGEEFLQTRHLVIKDMVGGDQYLMDADKFFDQLKRSAKK